MFEIKTDLHTHTLASIHAYSTVDEHVRTASEMGFEAVAITDHLRDPKFCEYAPYTIEHLANLKTLPKYIYGVRVFSGVEMDIIDKEGNLIFHDYPSDMLTEILDRLEIMIASIHNFDFSELSKTESTKVYVNALQNKRVKILGHPCRPLMKFEIDEVIKTSKENRKLVELNNLSMRRNNKEIDDYCKSFAIRCAELDVPVCVNSDAHCRYEVADISKVTKMLEEIDFPKHLIINKDLKTLQEYFNIE